MTDAKPYPKSSQLARGERRYRRKIAGPKRWAALRSEKLGPCRVCGDSDPRELHHVVPRDFHGDDLADNLVPLCAGCHRRVTANELAPCRVFCSNLTDAEYAYAVTKLGEQVWERVYGIEYQR